MGSFPPYVQTDEERKRWQLAAAIAEEIFGDVEDPATIWFAARSIYGSDLLTGDEAD